MWGSPSRKRSATAEGALQRCDCGTAQMALGGTPLASASWRTSTQSLRAMSRTLALLLKRPFKPVACSGVQDVSGDRA